MYLFTSKTGVLLKPIAVFAILAAYIFHLGDCPCGCIEHNAWLQGLQSIDKDSTEFGSDSLCEVASDHDHDCDGSRPQFLDTSHHPTCVKQLLFLSTVFKSAFVDGSSSALACVRSEGMQILLAPPRASLQVFLL